MRTTRIALLGMAAAWALFGAVSLSAQNDTPKPAKIESITSPAPGTVLIMVKPLKKFDNGYTSDAFPTFSYFRADGETDDMEDFTRLDAHRLSGPYDTVNAWSYSSAGITISNLRSGVQSFYIVLGYYTKANGYIETEPSNIETVNVQGTNDEDGQLSVSFQAFPASVAREYTPARFAAYPNPATNLVHLSTPGAFGAATVRVYDLEGTEVLNRTVADAASGCAINVASLPNGAYFAVVEQGEKRTRSAFSVVR